MESYLKKRVDNLPKSKKTASKKEDAENGTPKENSKICVICEREIEDLGENNYCKYHNTAYHNVMESYDEWQEGYGELSFSEYLKKLIDNPATGNWAKEVAEELLKRESSNK